MGRLIQCSFPDCGKESSADNIVDLIANHRDAKGGFMGSCGEHGYIERRCALQAVGEFREPFLRAEVTLARQPTCRF